MLSCMYGHSCATHSKLATVLVTDCSLKLEFFEESEPILVIVFQRYGGGVWEDVFDFVEVRAAAAMLTLQARC